MTQPHQPSDAWERQQAVDPSQSFLVQAPAGSGKTELVTDRILALLSIVQQPEEILAITFTRKAAAEMRVRVMEKLRLGLEENPPTQPHKQQAWQLAKKALKHDQDMGWHLLEYPTRLRVMTFDSFCARLVRSLPQTSKMGGMLGVVESPRTLYEKAAQQVLEQVQDNSSVQAVLRHLNVQWAGTKEMLIYMLGNRDQWQSYLENPAQALADMVMTLNGFILDQLDIAQQRLPLGFYPDGVNALAQWAQVWPEISSLKDIDVRPLEVDVDDLERWKAFAHAVLTNGGTIRKKVDKNLQVHPNSPYKADVVAMLKSLSQTQGVQILEQALVTLSVLPQNLITQTYTDLYKDLIHVLDLSVQALENVFIQEGQVDFIQIAMQANQGLGDDDQDPSDLLLALDSKINHLLVDEFQDTSQTQVNLLKKLVTGWQVGDGRTLFIVGDPMQSIYRFRKAEVGLFLTVAKNKALHQVPLTCLTLTQNFRSSQEIVQWNNQVFSQVFPAEDIADLGAIHYTPAVPFNGSVMDPAASFELEYYFKPEENIPDEARFFPDVQGAQQRLEERVVGFVKEALARHPDSEHPVAVLVKSRTQLGQLVKQFQQAQIPVRAVEMVPLGQTPCVVDLLQVICALSHRADRLAWFSLLRSPLCGLTLNTLHAFFGEHLDLPVYQQIEAIYDHPEQYRQIPDEEMARFQHMAGVLLNPSLAYEDLSFTSQVSYVWDQLGGPLLYPTPAQQQDVQTVLEKLDEFAPYGAVNVDQFKQVLERLYAASASEPHAVEIMTIHKSKGLEFEEVILYGLQVSRPQESTRLIQFENYQDTGLLMGLANTKIEGGEKDPLNHLIRQREAQRLKYEEQRLLYVGATRARQRLYLCALMALKSEKKTNALALDSLKESQFIKHLEAVLPPVDMPTLVADYQQRALPQGLPTMTNISLPLQRFTWSQIEALQGLQPARSHRQGVVNPPSLWQFADVYETAIGTVTHLWLAQMGQDHLKGWDAQRIEQGQALMTYQLQQEGVSAQRVVKAQERVQWLLKKALKEPQLTLALQSDHAYYEWSLVNQRGKLLIMDVVISTPQGWQIIDYKTSQRYPQESLEQFTQRLKQTYQEQMQSYVQYLEQYDGRPARAALFALSEGVWIDVMV